MKNTKSRMLSRAIAIAADKFDGKLDKGGQPYILHCLHVMNNVGNDIELKCIAVLHDVVEDTDATEEYLRVNGMSERVIRGVMSMTHDKNVVPYDDYIENQVAENIDSIEVKIEDLRHNSDITRLKGTRPKDFERIEKYHRSFVFLCDVRRNYYVGF